MARRQPATDLRWLPNYLRGFGLLAGARLFLRIRRLDRADSAAAEPVDVPGLGRIWLRAAQRDHAVFQQVWIKGEYHLAGAAPPQFERLMAAYRGMLAAGQRPLILDAGAHVGMSVLWWRRLFPEALILAVEPSPANLAVLRRNLEGVPGVVIRQAALAGAPGTLRIAGSGEAGAAVRLAETAEGESVPAVTVPQLMQEAGAERLLLAKVDIEGGEAAVFAADPTWLDRTEALAIEPHDWLFPGAGTSRPIFAAIGSRHFDFVGHGENMLLFRHPPPQGPAG